LSEVFRCTTLTWRKRIVAKSANGLVSSRAMRPRTPFVAPLAARLEMDQLEGFGEPRAEQQVHVRGYAAHGVAVRAADEDRGSGHALSCPSAA
jgi:hypothetical protein